MYRVIFKGRIVMVTTQHDSYLNKNNLNSGAGTSASATATTAASAAATTTAPNTAVYPAKAMTRPKTWAAAVASVLSVPQASRRWNAGGRTGKAGSRSRADSWCGGDNHKILQKKCDTSQFFCRMTEAVKLLSCQRSSPQVFVSRSVIWK